MSEEELKKIIEKLNNLDQLVLPNGATGAVWLEDVIDILKPKEDGRKYKQWEDIYPLTLIQMRYGNKYVAINCEEDSGHIQDVNTEEVHYRLEEWLEENVSPCPYGVGTTIMECMNNLLEAMNNKSY